MTNVVRIPVDLKDQRVAALVANEHKKVLADATELALRVLGPERTIEHLQNCIDWCRAPGRPK